MLSVGPFADVLVPAVVAEEDDNDNNANACYDVAPGHALLALGEPQRGALVAVAVGAQLFVYTQVAHPMLLEGGDLLKERLVLVKRLPWGEKIAAVRWLVTPRQRLIIVAHRCGARMSVVTDDLGWQLLASFDLPERGVCAFECAPVLADNDVESFSMIINGPFGAQILRISLSDSSVTVETMLRVAPGADILRFHGRLGLEAGRRGERYAYCEVRDQWLPIS